MVRALDWAPSRHPLIRSLSASTFQLNGAGAGSAKERNRQRGTGGHQRRLSNTLETLSGAVRVTGLGRLRAVGRLADAHTGFGWTRVGPVGEAVSWHASLAEHSSPAHFAEGYMPFRGSVAGMRSSCIEYVVTHECVRSSTGARRTSSKAAGAGDARLGQAQAEAGNRVTLMI